MDDDGGGGVVESDEASSIEAPGKSSMASILNEDEEPDPLS